MSIGNMHSMSRIHVLGAGSVGLLFAAHLKYAGHPITLLLRNREKVQKFKEAGSRVYVFNEWMEKNPPRKLLCTGHHTNEKIAPWYAEGFDADVTDGSNMSSKELRVHQSSRTHDQETAGGDQHDKITKLIIATKAQDVLSAYTAVKTRLDSKSTVVLLQNGMGVYEAIQREFYLPRDGGGCTTEDMPSFVIGTNSHGCMMSHNSPNGEFTTRHTEMGLCSFAARPSNLNPPVPPPTSTLDILTALSTLPLDTNIINWSELHLKLLLKLAANALVNPCTALANCKNGNLVPMHMVNPSQATVSTDDLLSQSLESLLESGSSEIAAIYARAHPHLQLSPKIILDHVLRIASMTARNTSSMLQDLRAGRATEIDWINGYLIRLGLQHAVPTPVNNILYTLIKLREGSALY